MKPFAAAVLCFAVIACAPPHIEDLNKAAGLVQQMTLVGTVGPVNIDPGATSVSFLPSRPTASSIDEVKVQSGFLIVDSPGRERLSFVAGSEEKGDQSFPLSNAAAVAPYPLYQYEVMNTLANRASIIVLTIAGDVLTDNYRVFTSDISGGNWTPGTAILFPGLVYGASVVPGPSSGPDDLVSLVDGGLSPAMDSAQFVSGGIVTDPPVSVSSVPLSSRTLYYFSTATGASVASYYAGGQWNCLQWFGLGTPIAMTGVTNRIDAVLTTGDLLSTEGGTLRLFDPNGGAGTQVLSVDLRGLQFCYEAYVGTAPYVFFALPLNVRNGEKAFDVYAIPSSAMEGLHE